jgi:hypothetical protein
MVPFKGIPAARGLSPVDLVYLDEDYRVIQEVESYPPASSESLKTDTTMFVVATSALVLPAHTIYSSQTQPGDQLVICVAEEMERRLKRLPSSITHPSPAQSSVFLAQKQPNIGVFNPPSLEDRSMNVQPIIEGPDEMIDTEPKVRKSNVLRSWLQNWLSSDRRRAERKPLPGLVAYYWTGGSPKAYRIGDISSQGFYLLTPERWFPGTLVLMTLQRTDTAGRNIEDSIAVQSKVVRWGDDGLGLAFVLAREMDETADQTESWADKKTLDQFLGRVNLPGNGSQSA